MTPSPSTLRARLPGLMLRDERRLWRRLDRARGSGALDGVAAEIERAERRVEQRRNAVPAVSYPPALPITERKDDILAAIRDHQVVIVAGETGSGKTTQLPKICLELGRGVRGSIGHTQPRRLAARTVAQRIADELQTPLGGTVGYAVRFDAKVGDQTLVKLMTDGILLTEIQHDRLLRQYDTLIIDEAHERSLNIDFLLGYLKQLLPRRPDLKVVITSATIDPDRFSRHFDDAPVIEVSGRMYPVEKRYRPIDEDSDQAQAICDAVDELCAEGTGDILVFLSGEREIRDTADALAATVPPGTEILPLYARLATADQNRVFQPSRNRRVVLATNVAETSLTVPGIRYVVDPGTARISRYSSRLKVQRLPIERISQASANQRAGRCGRLADGVCIRLYSQDDFEQRPAFTDPEILRTNLASVILQMTALQLGDIADFPFIDPPDRRNIRDGVALLRELGALERDGKRLTPAGRRLAQIPVDPRLGRMVLEADRNRCVHEVLVIVAALSIQDPRERPADAQQAADESHARFADPESDFLTYLNLWRYLTEQQRDLTSSRFRRLCKREFLHYLRVREWQDLYSQLRQVAQGLGLTVGDDGADAAAIHRSLLAGLLSHIGLKDGARNDYLGARGTRFAIFPGSALFKKPPTWVMAAELVETSRLWARTAARIEPEAAEALASHLVKRRYSEPHWERNRGAVMAYETVTLYGVPLASGRKVNMGRVDPELARELFIRKALVEGDWTTSHAFFAENRRLVEEVEDLEDRARRRDILVADDVLFDFYDQRVGKEVVSARHFDTWWRKAGATRPDLLTFDRSLLINETAGAVSERDYPDEWRQGELRLRLTYEFDPGSPTDGVTVTIPLPLLNQVAPHGFDWQVPGLREELVTALIRSLPKALRRPFVPVPDTARAVLARVTPDDGPLTAALARELGRHGGGVVAPDAWDLDRVPDHLRMTFRIVDELGRTVAQGKELDALKVQLRGRLQAALAAEAGGIERRGLRDWSVGTLPRTVEQRRSGYTVTVYPALVDEGDSVAVRVLGSEAEQRRAMARGTRRLLLLALPSPVSFVRGRLSNAAKLALGRNPYRDVPELLDDCTACAVDKLVAEHGGPAWDGDAFAALRARVHAELSATVVDVVREVSLILEAAHRIEDRLARTANPELADAVEDMRAQVAGLVYRGFVSATGWWRLPDVLRYLRGVEYRLDKLGNNPRRDRELTETVQELERAWRSNPDPPGDVRWMIEELRVSFFAQSLGTAYPVSEKRVLRAMDELRV